MKSLETNKVFLILPFLLCVIMAGAQSRNDSSYIEPVGIIEDLSDDELLEVVQRQTFRFFWHGAHPVSRMALERSDTVRAEYYWDYINEAWDEPNFSKTEFGPDACAVGGTGFGIMSVIIAVDRG
jgi:hypothetical protein